MPYHRLFKIGSLCFVWLITAWFSTACATPQPTQPMEAYLVPPTQNTPTNTPTIVWFPPTATYTPLPTVIVTPTFDVSPQKGKMIFQDDFTESANWALNQAATSSIALGDREITLAISQPGLYLFSLRKNPVLANFYLEINASPSLCAGSDEYGILYRVSSSLDFYRYALTCDGQVRLDKYFKNKASSPQPKTYSGSVPLGAPSSSRLAIWASGKIMRFYVNGEYQFTVQDPSIQSGSLGLFARSAEGGAVTISFSDLIVYDIRE